MAKRKSAMGLPHHVSLNGQLLDILVTCPYPTFPLNGLIIFPFFCYEELELFLWLDYKSNLIEDYQTSFSQISMIRVINKSILIRNGGIIWKVVWIEYYLRLNFSS